MIFDQDKQGTLCDGDAPLGYRSLTRRCRLILALYLLILSVALLPGKAAAGGWEDAIETVSKSADAYFTYAVEVGGTRWAGTMYNGYMSVEHQCAITGRMLGLDEAIKHIEEFDYPPMDARSDPHELLVFSISLENWVRAAKWALTASEDQRINFWNLDCVGQFKIASDLFINSNNPNAEFVVDGKQLHVYGDIDFGFAQRFDAVLRASPGVTEVTLGSGGGSVVDALVAGTIIRSRGLNTALYGNCYSACPLVFMGGTHRTIWAAPYRLGFHQIYTENGRPIAFDDELYQTVGHYIERMGGNQLSVLLWMYSASPSEMLEPQSQDLCDAIVATWIQRTCGIDMDR